MIRNEEWSTMRRLLLTRGAAGGALKEYEAEGNPAVFETNVAKPLTGFTIPFLPMQSGSGDPSPSNVRPISGWSGAKAQLSPEYCNCIPSGTWQDKTSAGITVQYYGAGLYHVFGTATANASVSFQIVPIHTPVNDGRTIALNNSQAIGTVAFYYNNLRVDSWNLNAINRTSTNFNTLKDKDIDKLYFTFASGDVVDMTVKPEFWCPADPQTVSVTFPATGKNLLNISESVMTESGWNRRFPLSIKEGTYTIACNGAMGNEKHGRVNLCDENYVSVKLIVPNYSFGQLTDQGPYTFTLTEGEAERVKYLQIEFISSGTTFADIESAYIQIESGASKTAYEPFDNTVYGGTVYPLDGRMLVEYVKKSAIWGNIKTGTPHAQTGYVHGQIQFGVGVVQCVSISDQGVNAFCNVAKIRLELEDKTPQHYYIYGSTYNTAHIYGDFDDDTEIVIVAKLAEPYEIPLDPITVQTLVGDNTIWTDTNGVNAVKYKKKG